MASDQGDFYYPPERLAELLALAENPGPIPKDAKIDPPELVKALRASALAYFAHLPISEQVEYMIGVSIEEQEDILADLPEEHRERLLIELGSVTLKMP